MALPHHTVREAAGSAVPVQRVYPERGIKSWLDDGAAGSIDWDCRGCDGAVVDSKARDRWMEVYLNVPGNNEFHRDIHQQQQFGLSILSIAI